ncbi:lytic transglycosylase domain-containing protein [Paenibacillus sp. y28]|uniref:lytic transglycosylase domain-containing protein n=1 Tax=Paenibacillus sp. y28 TaxID=3129110 RepID=UPI00301A2FA6
MNKIHPSVVQQLIQLQLQSAMDKPFGSTGTGASSTEFAGMLQSLVGAEDENAGLSSDSSAVQGLGRLSSYISIEAGKRAGGMSSAGQYDEIIERAAKRFGVDASLIKSVIQNESSFRPDAVSGAGAKGLMQLMDGTAKMLGVTNSFDPEQNINGGAKYLNYLLSKYNGNEALALAAYNAGPGRVDKLGVTHDAELMARRSELPEETRNYISRVLNTRNSYLG